MVRNYRSVRIVPHPLWLSESVDVNGFHPPDDSGYPDEVHVSSHSKAQCSAQTHGYVKGSPCQRRGRYRVEGYRGAYCQQHAEQHAGRSLSADETA